MDKMAVMGGATLNGSVRVSGAKNAALPIFFATLLAEGTHHIRNVPNLKDIESTLELLSTLSCTYERTQSEATIHVKKAASFAAHYDLVRKMRASILCLGPLLAKYGEAIVSLPGGCAIGTRPIDLHLDGMKALGAEIELKEGYVLAKAKRLKGANILFETSTVGGTENIMMAATLAEGTTVLENAAKEPEIVDLANYLIKMGAKISGHGTSVIKIEGVSKLVPAEHFIMPDRIEAGTLLIAGGITGGEVTVEGIESEIIESLVVKLRESGFKIHTEKQSLTIHKSKGWSAVDITTNPYPLFPTDLQAQFMALMTLSSGTSVITETVFENRFMHVQELSRLGADITPKTRVAVVRGVQNLTGAPVMATDLRASASLVLAGLKAQGETVIGRIYHLDRGYERLEEKLSSLGAKIKRVG
jgi:UDP-N-acetylglucosamine 1-carboxyvinyltransferase